VAFEAVQKKIAMDQSWMAQLENPLENPSFIDDFPSQQKNLKIYRCSPAIQNLYIY